jgi:hypothetical protein
MFFFYRIKESIFNVIQGEHTDHRYETENGNLTDKPSTYDYNQLTSWMPHRQTCERKIDPSYQLLFFFCSLKVQDSWENTSIRDKFDFWSFSQNLKQYLFLECGSLQGLQAAPKQQVIRWDLSSTKRSIDDIQGMLHAQTGHGQNLQKDHNISTNKHTRNMNLYNTKFRNYNLFYVQYEIY